MLLLSSTPLIIGIVVCLLTSMPASMIKNNLVKKGFTWAQAAHAVCEAQLQIRNMLTWHTIGEEDVMEVCE